jgi:hypothetical protein
MGSPARRLNKPDYTLPGTSPIRYAGTDDGRGTDPNA